MDRRRSIQSSHNQEFNQGTKSKKQKINKNRNFRQIFSAEKKHITNKGEL